MTVEVLFIQGAGAGAHAADRRMAVALGQALGEGFHVEFPPLPGEDDPGKAAWQDAIAAALRRTAAGLLVAHSAGAAIAAEMLARGDVALAGLRGVLLLAPPYVGEGGWSLPGFHFDELGPVGGRTGPPLHLFFASADQTVPPAHAGLYARVFPDAAIHRLAGGDHQFGGFMMRVAKTARALAGA